LRPDFHKVLCERPRHKPFNADKRHREGNIDYENKPTKESMKINHIRGWGGKELNEYLPPLYRYLNDQVGRRWDDVYSEIRKTIVGKNPNAVKGHILQHIFGFGGVELHSYPIGNKRYSNNGYYRSGPRELTNDQLYVDDEGVVRKYKNNKKKVNYAQVLKEKWMETARHLPNGNQARKINGIWYEITLSPILEAQILTTWSDINKYTKTRYATYIVLVNDVLGTRGEVKDFERIYKAKVYASSKKAMNSKDLRKHDLQND
jgi:hypothetical protein